MKYHWEMKETSHVLWRPGDIYFIASHIASHHIVPRSVKVMGVITVYLTVLVGIYRKALHKGMKGITFEIFPLEAYNHNINFCPENVLSPRNEHCLL